MPAAAPASIGLLGFGRFGRAFASLLQDEAMAVTAFDPHATIPRSIRAADIAELAQNAQCIMIAVPVREIDNALKNLRPHLKNTHLVIDVASVKQGPVHWMEKTLGADIPWIATHPLFGPMSIARGERPLRAVVCPNILHPHAAERARLLYERAGCTVIKEDADAHDRVMADTHALAFFVAKGMIETGAGKDVPFAPPSFQAMAQTIDAVRSDAGHLFYPIARANPYAAHARERLLKALTRIHADIAQTPESLPSQTPAPLEIPKPEGPAPELIETRDLIDELDGQLISLLARRVKLAFHAARVKAGQGRPVQDSKREEDLLSQRADQAAQHNLLSEEVRGVFDAILSLSRAEQERWLKRKK